MLAKKDILELGFDEIIHGGGASFYKEEEEYTIYVTAKEKVRVGITFYPTENSIELELISSYYGRIDNSLELETILNLLRR